MFPRPIRPRSRVGQKRERLSHAVTVWTGSSWAFALAATVILAWLVTGPLFQFSDTWQLVINTGTTIVTFLMVFLIQRSQNKDSRAIQIKLNELVAAINGASNRLINAEDLSEAEVTALHEHYKKLAELTKSRGSLTESHSVEEAERRDEMKHRDQPNQATRARPIQGPTPTVTDNRQTETPE